MGDFDGLRALVTGGASGIGLATAVALQAAGATVTVLDRADDPDLPDGLAFVHADISDSAGVAAAVDTAVETMRGLDILVNNAAIGAVGGVETNSDEEWHRVLDINVVGTVRVCRAALPALRASAAAAIVNIGSVAATVGLPQRALYSAAKGATLSLSQAMAADLLPEGIRVNVVNPGTADTPWVQRLLAQADDPAAERTALEARQPHGRLVAAEEVAAAVLYLAGPAAGSTTGTYVAVDGGMQTLRLRPRG
ncbi:SDR family oxidoreductase [Nakamurella sp. YIM 132087]|uniref:SDR family oxidoreductase n=1 Tax=Nakamurella alba TaxID=2665158 RepID=A0A7K1FGW8_9ACTN|nr:SDR family oxidoreductase [Nakamurella alba]MTD13377.1 SDR family oxidoreductase [Nakamurella alba]